MRLWILVLGIAVWAAGGCSLARTVGGAPSGDDGGTGEIDAGPGHDAGPPIDAWGDMDSGPQVDAWSAGEDAFVPTEDAFVPTEDAYMPPVDAYTAPDDAWMPPGCEATYSGVYAGYHACEETETTCAFVAHLDHGDTCSSVCRAGAGGCVGEYQNGNSASSCTRGTDDGCSRGIGSSGPAVNHICVCARF